MIIRHVHGVAGPLIEQHPGRRRIRCDGNHGARRIVAIARSVIHRQRKDTFGDGERVFVRIGIDPDFKRGVLIRILGGE